MFGPQMEKEIQVITLNTQERLKRVEQYRQIAQAIADEPRTAQAHHTSIGDLLGRLSFRHRTAPTGSAS
jgi:hypothetical protein